MPSNHKPVAEVVAWVTGRPARLVFTASVCQAEILAGIAIMSDDRRRQALDSAARAMFANDLDGRVMIASLARARGGSVAARDTSGFEGRGVALVNPWQTQ